MQDVALPWLVYNETKSPFAVGLLIFFRFVPFLHPRPVRRRPGRPDRQPADVDRDPDGLDDARLRPRCACVHRLAGHLGDLRRRDSRWCGRRDRGAEPPGARLPARRTGGAAERDRAQREPLQCGARRRAGARRCPDRRRGCRLVLRVQCCLVHGGADNAPADARLGALPGRARPPSLSRRSRRSGTVSPTSGARRSCARSSSARPP